jgi:hypothetical protein
VRVRLLALLLAMALTACVPTSKNLPPPPASPAPAPLEASYDWHGLLLVPFGSVLKEIPFTLHEVLLFHDAAQAPSSDEAECYAIEQAAPRLLARIPSEYMLCFKHDRLTRVQATVNLPQNEALQVLNDACGLWQRQGAAVQTELGARSEGRPAAAGQPADCAGRDGGIAYAGRVDRDESQSDAALTVTLDAAVQP